MGGGDSSEPDYEAGSPGKGHAFLNAEVERRTWMGTEESKESTFGSNSKKLKFYTA